MKNKIEGVVLFSSKILVAIGGVWLLALETKFLTPEKMGAYSLISGAISVLISIYVSWIGSAALRYYDAEKRKNCCMHFNATIFWSTVVATVLVVVSMIGVCFISINAAFLKYIPIIILLVIAKCFYEIYDKILRVGSNFFIYGFLTIVYGCLNVLLFFLFVNVLGDPLNALFVALIISTLVYGMISFVITKSYRNLSLCNFSKNAMQTYCQYGIPLIGVWAVSWLLNYSDRYMIQMFYSESEVGIYSISYSISQSSVGLIISTITVVLFPILIQKWNINGRNEATTYVNKVIAYYVTLMIPAVVGLGIISAEMFGVLIDMRYVDGKMVIVYSSIGFFFMGLNNILYKLWQLEEKTKKVLVFMVISVTINIILNLICLPNYGYKVASITTLISYLLTFIIIYALIYRDFKVKFNIATIIRAILSTTVMSLYLAVTKKYATNLFMLLGIIFTGVIMYIMCFIIMGGFRSETKALFRMGGKR